MIKFNPIAILLILLTVSCKNPTNKTVTEPQSQIEFKQMTYDYGTIPYLGDGTCKFEFINTSDVPLVINNVKTSCGCTSPEWPTDPCEPGSGGTIKIKYDTRIKGRFKKSITIYSNAKNSPVNLIISGEVSSDKPNE